MGKYTIEVTFVNAVGLFENLINSRDVNPL